MTKKYISYLLPFLVLQPSLSMAMDGQQQENGPHKHKHGRSSPKECQQALHQQITHPVETRDRAFFERVAHNAQSPTYVRECALGCLILLAQTYKDGLGVEKNLIEAHRILESVIDNDKTPAHIKAHALRILVQIALMHRHADRLPQARQLLARITENCEAPTAVRSLAQRARIQIAMEDTKINNVITFRHILEKITTTTPNSFAQLHFAYMNESGIGGKTDIHLAFLLYRKLLDNPKATAQEIAEGKSGVATTFPLLDTDVTWKEARSIFEKTLSDPRIPARRKVFARIKLANMYEFGLGVDENLSLANDLYKQVIDDPAATAEDKTKAQEGIEQVELRLLHREHRV